MQPYDADAAGCRTCPRDAGQGQCPASGLTLLRRVRAATDTPGAGADDGAWPHAGAHRRARFRADDYLGKPFRLAEVERHARWRNASRNAWDIDAARRAGASDKRLAPPPHYTAQRWS